MTMGLDFNYESASEWFGNLDKLIHYTNVLSGGRVNAFYSTPTAYTDAKHAEGIKWAVKTDDFFPCERRTFFSRKHVNPCPTASEPPAVERAKQRGGPRLGQDEIPHKTLNGYVLPC